MDRASLRFYRGIKIERRATTMASSSNSGELRLKLLIDNKSQKVLYAEAGKEFIDFLFSFMSLPLGTVAALLTKSSMMGSFTAPLTKTSMVGSLANLYHSIETLNPSNFLQPTQNKESILNPKICAADNYQTPLMFISHKNEPFNNRKAYVCKNLNTQQLNTCHHSGTPSGGGRFSFGFGAPVNSHGYVANDLNSVCPDCKNKMDAEVIYVSSPEKVGSINGDGGFVKGVVTYMVMDNLEVKPMSAISSITLINNFNISDLGSLEGKEVAVGVNEGLKLLKESMQSMSVLTKVFLDNN